MRDADNVTMIHHPVITQQENQEDHKSLVEPEEDVRAEYISKQLSFDPDLVDDISAKKCGEIWRKIIDQNLIPIRCSLAERRDLLTDSVSEKKPSLASIKSSSSTDTLNVSFKNIWKDAYTELEKKKFNKVTIGSVKKCNMCEILEAETDDKSEQRFKQMAREELAKLNDMSSASRSNLKTNRRSDINNLYNFIMRHTDRLKKIVEEKQISGIYREWRARSNRAICDCNLKDCICSSLSVKKFKKAMKPIKDDFSVTPVLRRRGKLRKNSATLKFRSKSFSIIDNASELTIVDRRSMLKLEKADTPKFAQNTVEVLRPERKLPFSKPEVRKQFTKKKIVDSSAPHTAHAHSILKSHLVGIVEQSAKESGKTENVKAVGCSCGHSDCQCNVVPVKPEKKVEAPRFEFEEHEYPSTSGKVMNFLQENPCCCGHKDCKCETPVVPCTQRKDTNEFHFGIDFLSDDSYTNFLATLKKNRRLTEGVAPTSVANAATQISRRLTNPNPTANDGYCVICGKSNTPCQTQKLSDVVAKEEKKKINIVN